MLGELGNVFGALAYIYVLHISRVETFHLAIVLQGFEFMIGQKTNALLSSILLALMAVLLNKKISGDVAHSDPVRVRARRVSKIIMVGGFG